MFSLLALWGARGVHADEDRRDRLVRAHLQGLGAHVAGEPTRVFLEQGESRVVVQQVAEGCVGFLAYGTGMVRDVDLSLHTEGGLLLDRDSLAAAYAYVRGCAGEPQSWFLDVRMYAGQGELRIVRLDGAPRGVGVLPFELGLAAPSGGVPERPRSVGPALPVPSLEQRLVLEEPAWQARGYLPASGILRVPMASGFARASVPLEEGLCYAVRVSSASSRHTAVVLADAGGERVSVGEPGDSATAHVCAKETAEHALFVRARPGAEVVLVRTYVHPDAARWKPDGEGLDRARLLVGELTHLFEARGLEAGVLGEGWIDALGPLRWSIPLEAGECTGLGAVDLGSEPRGYLELALEAPDGALMARDRRRETPPRVWHCAERGGVHRLVIRASGEVGRFALVRGRDARFVEGERATR